MTLMHRAAYVFVRNPDVERLLVFRSGSGRLHVLPDGAVEPSGVQLLGTISRASSFDDVEELLGA